MANTNPNVLQFKKALKVAYKRGQIRDRNGKVVLRDQFRKWAHMMFGPKRDPDGRRQLIRQNFDHWKKVGVTFPGYVHKSYLALLKNLHNKSIWDEIADGAISVMSSPAFSAVIGVATAAIPGVGVALAPVAVAVQRGVTNAVAAARKGDLKAQNVLADVANVAAAGAGASGNPAIAAAIRTGQTTAAQVQAHARVAVAAARAAAQPQITGELRASRELVLRAKAGDGKAMLRLRRIARSAKAGDAKAVRALALVTAVGQGMVQGHIPPATPEEKRRWRVFAPGLNAAITRAAESLDEHEAQEGGDTYVSEYAEPEPTQYEDERLNDVPSEDWADDDEPPTEYDACSCASVSDDRVGDDRVDDAVGNGKAPALRLGSLKGLKVPPPKPTLRPGSLKGLSVPKPAAPTLRPGSLPGLVVPKPAAVAPAVPMLRPGSLPGLVVPKPAAVAPAALASPLVIPTRRTTAPSSPARLAALLSPAAVLSAAAAAPPPAEPSPGYGPGSEAGPADDEPDHPIPEQDAYEDYADDPWGDSDSSWDVEYDAGGWDSEGIDDDELAAMVVAGEVAGDAA